MTTHIAPHPHQLNDLNDYLAHVERARQRQLDSLPTADRDVVAAAHRASVERILHDVRTARQRLRIGAYGECTQCQGSIATERLEVRPWATTCSRCSRR